MRLFSLFSNISCCLSIKKKKKTYPGGTFTCLRAAVSHSTPFDFFYKLLYQLIIFFSAAWSFRGINFRLSRPFQGKYKDIR